MPHIYPFFTGRSGIRSSIFMMVVAVAAFLLGYLVAGRFPGDPSGGVAKTGSVLAEQRLDGSQSPGDQGKKQTLWTCSMHPHIKLPNPGKCPICFMDLIPLEDQTVSSDETGIRRYTMSEKAKKLAEVATTLVRRQQTNVTVRMVGLVVEDETRFAALTARVDGRLEEIYINFTGETVRRGDPMVKIWSPTLIKSQVELFESQRTESSYSEVIRGAEEKLIQYGLTREQIEEIKQQKRPILYLTLRAPINGVVMKKNVVLGQFVKEGQEMYTINDLSRVWVKLDAYETDIPWLKYGQNVSFTTPSIPGQTFRGKVLFIDPFLDTRTRSIKIRVEAENPQLTLKPGMFVTAHVEAEIDAKGRIIKSEWAGKYICPIHPSEYPSSEPGICPDSNMPLRPASAYGYVDETEPELPLVIPVTSPLITGKRAIVYVEVPNTDRPTYELRNVVLGPRTVDTYVVYEGLTEGERVVTHGNFKIDSAMQILGRPSMMNSLPDQVKSTPPKRVEEDEIVQKITVPSAFLNGLTPVIGHYLALTEALVEEKSEEAASFAHNLIENLRVIDNSSLERPAQEAWDRLTNKILEALTRIKTAKTLSQQRNEFGPMSEHFTRLLMTFRHVLADPLLVYYCPMAFAGEGAYWLQTNQGPRNPYFGHQPVKGQNMLNCGELIEKIPPESQSETPGTTQNDELLHPSRDQNHRGH